MAVFDVITDHDSVAARRSLMDLLVTTRYLCDGIPASGKVDKSLPIHHLRSLFFRLLLPGQKICPLFSEPRMENRIVSNIELMFELREALPGLSEDVHGLFVVVMEEHGCTSESTQRGGQMCTHID